MTASKSPRRRAGACARHARCAFTLIELVVASAVLLLLAGVLLGFSREVTKSWERLQAEQRRFAGLLALDRTLDAMLSNVVPFVWRDGDGLPVPVFIGEPDRARFAYLHRISARQDGALRFVDLAVSEERLIALYQQRPFVDASNVGDALRASVLAENVESVEFLYADVVPDQGLDWFEEWDPERTDLPLAIAVTVTWLDGRAESWLRRTAGNGMRERWGRVVTQPVGGAQ